MAIIGSERTYEQRQAETATEEEQNQAIAT